MAHGTGSEPCCAVLWRFHPGRSFPAGPGECPGASCGGGAQALAMEQKNHHG